MNDQEAIKYLEEIKKYGSIPGLESIQRLLNKIGNPQEKLRVIHVAGTNGKGSILAMLESILRTSGYRTGRYHSPVLFDIREAFQVNEEWIKKEDLCIYVDKLKNAADEIVREGFVHPTSFEFETALAFLYFLDQKVDVVLLETGMGGRLDATNVVSKPLVEILASISMDHMQFLGDSIEAITREKAGIIKTNTDVVLYPSDEAVFDIVKQTVDEKHARLTMADAGTVQILSQDFDGQRFSYRCQNGHLYKNIEIPLLGDHQIYNAITVIEVLEILKKYFCMGIFEIEEGLRKVKWPGRLEVIGRDPYIIRDGAHNEDAALRLAQFVEKNFTNKKIFYIIGVLRDKEYKKILKTMSSYTDTVYTVASDSPRALPTKDLAECAREYYSNVKAETDVRQAILDAKQQAGKDDVILIFGSLSFMKEIEEMRQDGTISADSRS